MKKIPGNLVILPLSSHPEMVSNISDYLKIKPGSIEVSTFSSGEIYTRVLENIRGDHVYLLQTTTLKVNHNIMELLIAVDSCKRASAKTINAIIPHFPYSRQDKKTASREPITARLIANLLEAAGVDRIITMDLHADQIQGFFNIPVDHLNSFPLFVKYFKQVIKDKKSGFTVVSPDTGRAKVCKKFSDHLGINLAILQKARPGHNVSEVLRVIGDVKDQKCILYDDIIDTAGSVVNAYKVLKINGAYKVYLAVTHPVLSGMAVEKLNSCDFTDIVVTNTIPLVNDKAIKNASIIDASLLFAEAVKRNHEHTSISKLFTIE